MPMVTFYDVTRGIARRRVYRYENSGRYRISRVAQALRRVARYDSRCSIGRAKEYPRFGGGVR